MFAGASGAADRERGRCDAQRRRAKKLFEHDGNCSAPVERNLNRERKSQSMKLTRTISSGLMTSGLADRQLPDSGNKLPMLHHG